ncbi:hypothetical protein Tco_1458629 [Tanacetum coccineum]
MSSSPSHATVTYTSMSSDDDVPSWGIPLMDAYDFDPEAPEAAPQSPDQAPLSPAHALPLPASVSPTAFSPDYSTDSKPAEKDPKEDPEEEPSKEEEELSALTDSPPTRLYIDLPSEVEEDEVPSTPPSPTSHHHIIPLSQTRLRRARMFKIGESSTVAAAKQPEFALAQGTESGFVTVLEEVNERVTDLATSHRHDSHEAGGHKMTSTRTSMSQEALEELISQHVADALATYDTNRSNGDDSHDSGSGGRRTVHTTRECTYSDFLKCQPLNFKGTEGAVGLAQWFEKGIYVPYQQLHYGMPSEVCHMYFAGRCSDMVEFPCLDCRTQCCLWDALEDIDENDD